MTIIFIFSQKPPLLSCYHSSLDREGQSNENLKTSCMLLLNVLKMVSCTLVFRKKCTVNLFSRKLPHKTIIYLISILLLRYIVLPMLIKRRNMKLTSKEKSRSYRFVLSYTISSN